MKNVLFFFFAVLLMIPLVAAHAADDGDASIVLIYESSGKQTDQAFIDMARKGAERAKAELGIEFIEHEIQQGEDRLKVFEQYASSGKQQIIGLGFQNVKPVLSLAEKHPNSYFTVIDGTVPPLFENVQSIVFRDNEGAFLVGILAAMQSKTGTIGFIGGMDVPLIRDFAYGYRQGAQYANKRINVMQNMIGNTKEAFSNPTQAAKLAREQINNGADVIFSAAGGSSFGMLEEVVKYDQVYAIGVDTNQNGFFPGSMLTSMVKRVDLAVYESMKQVNLNTWQSGIKYFGIKEGALDYAVDKHNRKLLTKEMVDKVERSKDLILRGLVKVDNYRVK